MHFHQEFLREAYVFSLQPNWRHAGSAALLEAFWRSTIAHRKKRSLHVPPWCTHTSTSAFFHPSEVAWFPIGVCLKRLHLSCHFGAHSCDGTRSNTRAPSTWEAQRSDQQTKRKFYLFSKRMKLFSFLLRKLLGGHEDTENVSFRFVIFEELLRSRVRNEDPARGADSFHLSCILRWQKPSWQEGNEGAINHLFLRSFLLGPRARRLIC